MAGEYEGKAIAWDLSGTLISGDPREWKTNSEAFLSQLEGMGLTHFLVTGGSKSDTIQDLEMYKLRRFFPDGRIIHKGLSAPSSSGKLYDSVARVMGWNTQQALDSFIVIADKEVDAPRDLVGAVFVLFPGCFKADVRLPVGLVEALLLEGDFQTGFVRMVERAIDGKVTLENGISFDVKNDPGRDEAGRYYAPMIHTVTFDEGQMVIPKPVVPAVLKEGPHTQPKLF